MSSGLFVISCPTCEREIHLDAAGHGLCAGCLVRYLHRFGELIPLSRPRVGEPGVAVADADADVDADAMSAAAQERM